MKKLKEEKITGKPKYACSKCGVMVRELHDLEFCRKCFNQRHLIIGTPYFKPRLITKSKSVKKI